ncbi:hypothetical protein AB0B31_27985 [Catellatospora citrea]|uniref:hypothetical protein n=1 Tax=Catellatospora citrea TaxID=53366 RepID=UPI00340F8C21
MDYLSRERDKPSWGEDIFDTCQVLKALHLFRRSAVANSRLETGVEYLVEQVRNDFAGHREGDWFGPGFYAVALDLLSLHGSYRSDCANLLEKIATFQNTEHGYFGRPEQSIDLKIWHTTNCLLALGAQGLPTSTQATEAALRWLEQVQDQHSGSWGSGFARLNALYTSYAILAITAFRGPDTPAVQAGLKWLLDHQSSEDGRIEGIEGTVMAAWAFSRLFPSPMSPTIPMTQLIEINAVLNEEELAIASLEGELDRALADLANAKAAIGENDGKYLLRLTNKTAAQIGLGLGIVSLILAMMAWLAPDMFKGLGIGVTPLPSMSSTISSE